MRLLRLVGGAGLLAHAAGAIEIVLGNEASIKAAAKQIAFGMVKFYTGNNTGDTPGNLPDPYFWWEAGAMFGHLVDYWKLTGDETYNDITMQALVHQSSPTADFMPENQTLTLGNDDQGFWAMSAMSAAENNFPNPPPDQPQYLAVVQAVFNQWTGRWDALTCGGGLRWQVFQFNNGFDYKNSISNGAFFNIAARLARFTGNQTYLDWAERIWQWELDTGLITAQGDVFDGVKAENKAARDCDEMDTIQWTYNAGIFLHGAANMYNVTENLVWGQRVAALLNTTINRFYKDGIMVEQFCEEPRLCDIDQRSFKGYLTRWLAGTTQLVPETFRFIYPLLQSTATAAARACSGPVGARTPPEPDFKGIDGTACGFSWTNGYDGLVGVGEQMNALSAVMYTLIPNTTAPLTADTGGTSVGNPDAGSTTRSPFRQLGPIRTADRVGAGFLTTVFLIGIVGGSAFVMS